VPFWLPLAPQRFTHPAGRVLGQLADDVGVGAQGQADLRVAEDLHRYPRRHSLLNTGSQQCWFSVEWLGGGVPGRAIRLVLMSVG